MADPMYTDRQSVENYLLIDIDEGFWDQIDEWIAAVSQHIAKETGRNFNVGVETEPSEHVYDGSGIDSLVIEDCLAVTKLEIGETEVDSDEYFLYPANGTPKYQIALQHGRRFPNGRQNITITGRWGYSDVAPADIKFAATVLVAGIINTSNGDQGDVQSETIGRYSVTYKTTKEVTDYEEALRIIKIYRRVSF